MAFRRLRSLASLSELVSEGKSGALFYYTADGKFIIKTIDVGPERASKLISVLRADADFLKSHGLMDYSLLVGIYYAPKGTPRAAVQARASAAVADAAAALTEAVGGREEAAGSWLLLLAAAAAAAAAALDRCVKEEQLVALEIEMCSTDSASAGLWREEHVNLEFIGNQTTESSSAAAAAAAAAAGVSYRQQSFVRPPTASATPTHSPHGDCGF
ncbi:hypothetical protein Emag_005670 [Eimeria magna]